MGGVLNGNKEWHVVVNVGEQGFIMMSIGNWCWVNLLCNGG